MDSFQRKNINRETYLQKLKCKEQISRPKISYNFGMEVETKYKKHTFQIKQIQWISNYNLYLTIDDRMLNLFDASGHCKEQLQSSEITKSSSIASIFYIEPYHVTSNQLYVAAANDSLLYILSDFLEVIKQYKTELGLIQDIQYCDQGNLLFLQGTLSVHVYQFIVTARTDIQRAIQLDPKGSFLNFSISIVQVLQPEINWVKNFKLDEKNQRVILWSESSACLYSLMSQQLLAIARDVCEGTLITDMIVAQAHGYLLAGTYNGGIYCFKIRTHCELQHVFEGHNKQIIALSHLENPDFFLSGSSDNTVRIWNFNTFQQVYQFKIPKLSSPTNFIKFISSEFVVYLKQTKICIARLRLDCEYFGKTNIQVKKIKSIGMKLAVLCEDNGILVYDAMGQLDSTIYPLPNSNEIKEYYYQKDIDRMIVLFNTGLICQYQQQEQVWLLSKTIYPGQIKDTDQKAVLAPISHLDFIMNKPPFYDCELIMQINNRKLSKFFQEHPCQFPNRFCLMIVGKGIILFNPIEHLDRVYARFSLHRESIQKVQEVGKYLVTVCMQNIMKVWEFQENALQNLYQFDIRRNVELIQSLSNNRFVISYQNSEMEFFHISDNFYKIEGQNMFEHSQNLLSLAYSYNFNVLLSSGQDKKLKIWTPNKQLIREIVFPQVIESLCILDNGLIIASHFGTITKLQYKEISLIYDQPYSEIIVDEDMFLQVPRQKPQQKAENELGINFQELGITDELYNQALKYMGDFENFKQVDILAEDWKRQQRRRSHRRAYTKETPPYVKAKKRPISPKLCALNDEYARLMKRRIPNIRIKRKQDHQVILTRRQLTEQKIIQNIRMFGQPGEKRDLSGLHILDEVSYMQEYNKNLNRSVL